MTKPIRISRIESGAEDVTAPRSPGDGSVTSNFGSMTSLCSLFTSKQVYLQNSYQLVLPFPVANFRHILTVLSDVLSMFNQLVADKLLSIGGCVTQFGYSINYIKNEMKAV